VAQHPRQILRLEVVGPIGTVDDEEYSRPRVGPLWFIPIVLRGIVHLAGFRTMFFFGRSVIYLLCRAQSKVFRRPPVSVCLT